MTSHSRRSAVMPRMVGGRRCGRSRRSRSGRVRTTVCYRCAHECAHESATARRSSSPPSTRSPGRAAAAATWRTPWRRRCGGIARYAAIQGDGRRLEGPSRSSRPTQSVVEWVREGRRQTRRPVGRGARSDDEYVLDSTFLIDHLRATPAAIDAARRSMYVAGDDPIVTDVDGGRGMGRATYRDAMPRSTSLLRYLEYVQPARRRLAWPGLAGRGARARDEPLDTPDALIAATAYRPGRGRPDTERPGLRADPRADRDLLTERRGPRPGRHVRRRRRCRPRDPGGRRAPSRRPGGSSAAARSGRP